MGRDLGRAVLMRCPARSIGVVLTGPVLAAVLAALLSASPASAADPTPAPDPLTPAVISPSVSPPSQEQIDDAKNALERLRKQGGSTPTTTLTQVAGPTAEHPHRSVDLRISDQGWWVIGAGLLVLLVASETTRVSVRRAKHRKGA